MAGGIHRNIAARVKKQRETSKCALWFSTMNRIATKEHRYISFYNCCGKLCSSTTAMLKMVKLDGENGYDDEQPSALDRD